MSDPAQAAARLLCAQPLEARAASVARAVAGVLEARCSAESGAKEASMFLHEWANGAAAEVTPGPSVLDQLARRFGLSDHECDLVVLAGLADEHEGIATTFRSIHPQGEPRPTAGLAALLMGGTWADRKQVRGTLTGGAAVRHGLLRLAGPGTFFERSLVLPACMWDALHGHDAWPAELARVTMPETPAGLDGWLATDPVATATGVLGGDRRAAILVLSDDESIGLARCAALAAAVDRRLVAARVGPGDGAGIALLSVHAAVRSATPVLVVDGGADGVGVPVALGDIPGTVVVSAPAGAVRPAADRAVLALAAGPVDARDQAAAWGNAAPGLAAHARTLAARHPLDPAITAQLASDVRAQECDLMLADVSALVRTRAAASLPTGVRLVTPAVPWSHIVLPAEGALQLRDAVSRLEHQSVVLDDWGLRDRAHASRGARLLLTGPPGTGKSLAAHAIATAAQTDLLIVDVSRVVSKWLGETEKNLAAAFDAAERTQAVLLLDEADALFGTRTEISDAHDRYANLETAYLLQRLDRFDGLAVLTTNLKANIDAAFMRRMDFVVEFPLPDKVGRVELWERHLPPEAVADDVNVEALGSLYAVPGAWIRNATVAAAFGAAATHGRITQDHLVAAMRREYAKSSLAFPGEPPRRRHDAM